MLIGDVLAITAGLAAICASAWALMVGIAVMFSHRTRTACRAVERNGWSTLAIGLPITLVGAFLSIVLVNAPNPLAKLVGTVVYLGLIAIAVVGAGGLAAFVGRKIEPLDPSISPFKALARGAAILVLGCLLPIFGWFLFAPILLVMSIGAGVRALVAKPAAPPVMSDFGAIQ